MSTDVFIVGAGPAGLAASIAAAAAGFSVEVADTLRPPLDKPCGEGLMPDALSALARLGVLLDGVETAPFRGVRFIGPSTRAKSTSVEACFPAGTGRGVRRTLLSGLLLARAEELGVTFRWQTTVRALDATTVHFDGGSTQARFVVGADGHQSHVRRLAGLEERSIRTKRVGLRQHYRIPPEAGGVADMVEVYWAEHSQAYVTPVAHDAVCIAIITRHKLATFAEEIAKFPLLLARLDGAVPTDTVRGAVTLDTRVRRVTRGNVALIGDASGGVDALTGEGMALGFRQASALAAAFCANDLPQYETAHRSIARLPHVMSAAMMLLDRFPLLRNQALDVFQWQPAIFQRMFNMHVGEHHQPPMPGRNAALTLALRFLQA